MKKNIKKIELYLLLLIIFWFPAVVSAGPFSNTDNIKSNMEVLGKGAEFTPDSEGTQMTEIIATVIQVFLSLLGLIFIILILYAGYNWMSAGGDEQKVTKAKETIQRAIIGLVIIVLAYSITYFVFNNLSLGDGPGISEPVNPNIDGGADGEAPPPPPPPPPP